MEKNQQIKLFIVCVYVDVDQQIQFFCIREVFLNKYFPTVCTISSLGDVLSQKKFQKEI